MFAHSPDLLGITASLARPPGAVGHISDINIDHYYICGTFLKGLHYTDRIHKVIN